MELNDVLNTDRLVGLRPLHMDDENSVGFKKRAHLLRYFDFLVSVSQFFGFLMLVLTGYYFSIIDHGFQWGADGVAPGMVSHGFGNVNYHGLFMTIGFIFFQGEALLSYRLYRHEPKLMSKCIHAAFHIGAVVLVTFAMIAIVNHKNLGAARIQHMYSIHSWIGVGIISVFLVQLFLGFSAFFFPKASRDLRRKFLPIHRTVGFISFSASLAQVVIGNQSYQAILSNNCSDTLSCPDHRFLIQNFAMIATVLYGISIIVLCVNPNWRRAPTPDEKEA